ncbi:MAG: PKD domain-containing protein [Nitrososphaerota archaeon]
MRYSVLILSLIALSALSVTGSAARNEEHSRLLNTPSDLPILVSCGGAPCQSVNGVIAAAVNDFLTFEYTSSRDGAIGHIVLLEWSFGDGTSAKTEIVKPVQKRFTTPGVYTVTVTVWRRVGDLEIKGYKHEVSLLIVKAPYTNDLCMIAGVYAIQLDSFFCGLVNNILGFLVGKLFPQQQVPRR